MTEFAPPDPRRDDRDEGVLWSLAASDADSEPENLAVPIVFRRQARPVEARRRVAYRTALLVLILAGFNRNAARIDNLHLLMWATRSARTRRLFEAWWSGRRFANTVTQRLDPDLEVTINLALVDGLVASTGSNRERVRLTEKGMQFATLINARSGLLNIEKEFIASLAVLSDAAVRQHLGGSL